MKKRISSLLLILGVLLIVFPNKLQAAGFSYYTSKDCSLESVLSTVKNQSFNTSMTCEKATTFIESYINNSSSYKKAPNKGEMKPVGTDGIYTTNLGGLSKGCYHYAEFIAITMYGNDYKRIYIDQPKGKITADGLKLFLQKYGQSGEHIRIDSAHSLSFIGCTDTGFYTLQYYGDHREPFLSFSTYKYFAEILNKINCEFWIYDSDSASNTTISLINDTKKTSCINHSYNELGYCTSCGIEYPINFTSISSNLYYTSKNDVPVRSRPYAPDNILNSLSKGTEVTVVGSGENSLGNLWYKTNDGKWIFSKNLIVKNNTQIPVHTHNYSKLPHSYFEALHPHKVYETCSCGLTRYTGETISMPDCKQCKKSSETVENFILKCKSSNTATVSWSPVPSANSYEVEFWSRHWNSWRADYEYSLYLDSKTTSYLTNGLNNSSYEFRVRAVFNSGYSDWVYYTLYK